MVNLLYCELLKLKRSKMLLISFLGALVAPILMFANGVRMHYSRPDMIIEMADFYESSTVYSMLMFGLIIYVVIAAYLFSREYTENTLKTILTIPVQKLTFITSKFIMLFIWIIVLSLISWIGIYILSVIYNVMFGLTGFGIEIAFEFLGKMLFSGVLMFLTISPFAFLAVRTKGVVMPVISAAIVAMINVILSNEDLGAFFPWTAIYFLVSDKLMQTGYPYPLVIGLIAFVSVLGFAMCGIYFQKEDVK